MYLQNICQSLTFYVDFFHLYIVFAVFLIPQFHKMSSKQAMRLLNAMDRAKRQKANQRMLRAARALRSQFYAGAGNAASTQYKVLGSTYKDASAQQRLYRRALGYRGAGGYFMQKLFGAKKGGWLDRLGDVVTDTVLPIVPGGAIAQKAINVGGALASRVFPLSGAGAYSGMGAYEDAPAANALMHIPADHAGASEVPVVTSTGSSDGAIIVKHKEYVSDISSATLGFGNQSFVINPGLEHTFPWLSQVAANFTEYTLRQCIFTYKSAIAPIGASITGQVGSIIMASQYNVSDEPFTSKQEMLLEAGSCADMVTRDMIFGIECDPSKLSGAPGKYIREAPVVVGSDIKSYDHAILNVAVDSIPAGYLNQNVGELWVEYTVELRKPRLYTGHGDAISRDVWGQANPTGGLIVLPHTNQAAQSWSRPFIGSTTMVKAQQNSIGGQLQNTTNTYLFPNGYSGNLVIKGYMASADVLNFAGWTSAPTGFTFQTTGNVRLIADIPSVSTATPFVTSRQAVQWSTGQLVVMTFEVHVAVDIASNGVVNSFSFTTPVDQLGFIVAAAGNTCGAATLDLEEYNTTLNYKQNGTNDGIVFVDQVTGQVTAWTG